MFTSSKGSRGGLVVGRTLLAATRARRARIRKPLSETRKSHATGSSITPIESHRLPELEERVLHQLLRVAPAPGDEVQGSVQAVVLIEEEPFEALPFHGRLAFSAELHDVSLALHASMDARLGSFV